MEKSQILHRHDKIRITKSFVVQFSEGILKMHSKSFFRHLFYLFFNLNLKHVIPLKLTPPRYISEQNDKHGKHVGTLLAV